MVRLLVLITLFFLPAYLIRFSIFGIPTTLLEILIYILFIVFLMKDRHLINLKKNPYIIPIILLIIASLISIYISPSRSVAMGIFKGFIIDPILLFLVIYNVKDEDKILFLKSFLLSGIYISLYVIFSRILGKNELDGRTVGIFGYSPNYVSLYLAPIVVGCFGLLFGKGKTQKIIFALVLALSLIAIYLSGSRGGLVSVVAGFIGFGIIKYWSALKRVALFKPLLIVGILAVFVLGYYFYRPNFSANPELIGRTSSSSNIRVEIWKTSLQMIAKNPIFGVGLGNFQNYFTEFTKDRANFPQLIAPWALTPHNIFLNFYLNLGLLGLISFIWILLIKFRNYQPQNSLSQISLAILISIVVYGFLDTPYWKNDLSAIFWLIIAI